MKTICLSLRVIKPTLVSLGSMAALISQSFTCLQFCPLVCRSNQIENENHFLFHCDCYRTIRQQITSDIVLKYPSFNLLNDTEKTIFLFNNSDSFVCKKLGYFVYEALNIRETFNLI